MQEGPIPKKPKKTSKRDVSPKRLKKAKDKSSGSTSKWQHFLKKNGYVVVSKVLSTEQLAFYRGKFWDWMESFDTGIKRNDQATWIAANWPHSMHGLLQHFGIGHALWVWMLRTEPRILKVFAKIWDVLPEDLLCSFDGANLTRPTKRETPGWEHLDQGMKNSDFACVQGCMVLQTCEGGLRFYRKSHRQHASFWKASGAKSTGNWYKLTDADKDWYTKRCETVDVPNKEGDLVLWDSRTVHWGYAPPAEAPDSAPRMCAYVSYLPRQMATDKQLERKREVFGQRRMTSHWAVPCKLFSETFQHYGHPELLQRFSKRPTIKDEEMTPAMWSLVGVRPAPAPQAE